MAYLKKTEMDELDSKGIVTIIFENIIYFSLVILLPWIRYEFGDKNTYDSWIELFHAKFN